MLIYNGQIIAGGGTIVLPMTRAEYEANKAILDSADVWVDLTDEPDDIATADQVAFWVGQTQKSVGYIGDIATKALAKVEPTDTALYLHEVGTYFINKDGNMCMTDLQIAVNGTITLGTNCHVVDGGITSKLSQKVLIENRAISSSVIDVTSDIPNGYIPTNFVLTGGSGTVVTDTCWAYVWKNVATSHWNISFRGWEDWSLISSGNATGYIVCEKI